LEFNVRFQHKYGYITDERSGVESYPYPLKEGYVKNKIKTKTMTVIISAVDV